MSTPETKESTLVVPVTAISCGFSNWLLDHEYIRELWSEAPRHKTMKRDPPRGNTDSHVTPWTGKL